MIKIEYNDVIMTDKEVEEELLTMYEKEIVDKILERQIKDNSIIGRKY